MVPLSNVTVPVKYCGCIGCSGKQATSVAKAEIASATIKNIATIFFILLLLSSKDIVIVILTYI